MAMQNDRLSEPAERTNALLHDGAATTAILLATCSALMAMAAWLALFVHGGNVRFSPVFWLFAAVFSLWFLPLVHYRPGALKLLRFSLIAWPLLCIGGVIARVLDRTVSELANLPALAIFAALATAAACAEFALRKSSMPGGTRAAGRLPLTPPSTSPLVDRTLLSPIDRDGNVRVITQYDVMAAEPGWMLAGSAAISGTVINGIWLCIVIGLTVHGTQLVPLSIVTGVTALASSGFYLYAIRTFGRHPDAAHQMRITWALLVAVCYVSGSAAEQLWLLSPAAGGDVDPNGRTILDTIAVLGAVLPTVAMMYALRGLRSLDLADLARFGYRAGISKTASISKRKNK